MKALECMFVTFQRVWKNGSLIKYCQCYETIDLFSLYILFSHFRPRDATRGNSFFQMSSYARANLRITNEKQKENSHEGITWSEMGKQNVQAEKVYWLMVSVLPLSCGC